MSKSCFTCKAHVVVKCCSKCQAVQYCSKSCQKKDWKQHKQICQFLNVGDGAMQLQTDEQVAEFGKLEEHFQGAERGFDEDMKRFFKLFTESTLEGSKTAAREMKEIAARQTERTQRSMFYYGLSLLMRTDSEKLRWPNSPLRIMLYFVDANLELATGMTPLHHLSYQRDPKDHSFHKNQVILGQQLFRHGANANLGTLPAGLTPLHSACNSSVVTNLDFIQLLLENGASPNAQDVDGMTPVMYTLDMAPGAAKFLLEWCTPSTTDIDIHIRTNQLGITLFDMVHLTILEFADQAASPDCPDQRVKNSFLLQQWREIETMLVERGGIRLISTRISAGD
jgi:hypothetical protein